ncbi:MAG: sensor histidine kinase, partial [Clostridiales bacterium]|nr:sensor histidine kinase [Clostridiales bacterium]
MEGVSNLPEDMRGITLTLQKKAGLILLQVENPYLGEIKQQDGLPLTTKEDQNYHGFGMKSMAWLAKKYHGFISIKTENQVFVFRMTIPEPEEKDP